MELLEKEIETLDNIKDITLKIQKMKEIKKQILIQKNKIHKYIESLNMNEYKYNKNLDNLSLEQLLSNFETCTCIEQKIMLFNQIQTIYKNEENELFDQ
jgi:hypothetical protein